ncbi:hypothetical protein NQ176_g10881 [Zarea fungicola]|uniref:Uncharacterized protein n=1 Tax=Zarea fungicola TaxID=93591 RepID=A0ACC1MFA8_9HYPO|nr:hypothetical protein NQ176_g10881 [Lecanicillium fungicola]
MDALAGRQAIVLKLELIRQLLEEWKHRSGIHATDEEEEQAEQLLEQLEDACKDGIAVIRRNQANLWVHEIKFVEVLAFVYHKQGYDDDSRSEVSKAQTLKEELYRRLNAGIPLSEDGFEDVSPISRDAFFMFRTYPYLVRWVYFFSY